VAESRVANLTNPHCVALNARINQSPFCTTKLSYSAATNKINVRKTIVEKVTQKNLTILSVNRPAPCKIQAITDIGTSEKRHVKNKNAVIVLVSFGYRNWWNGGRHGKTAFSMMELKIISS